MKQKGKIYLLIGYLGSGKTTFIRNLLTNKKSEKYAIIQNQFTQKNENNQQQMGIQMPLIMDQSGIPFSSFLQLPNGCLCCSAKNDLIAGVQYILNNTDVRNIVVQTNGLADPAQVIKQFWFDQKLQMNAQLHSIVTLISIRKYQHLKIQNLFHKQVIYANRILLTFIDKSTNEQIKQVEQAVRLQNSQCVIAKNNDYQVIEFLKGDNLFSMQNLIRQSKINKNICNNQNHFHENQQQHTSCQHNENYKNIHQGIRSYRIKSKTNAKTKSQFQCCVGELLWESGMKILRIKGLICLPDNQFTYQLQGVDDLFQLKETKTSKQKVNNQSIVLVIGQNLIIQKLYSILKFD